MTYVITQSCCNDTVCVEVCPVDAIHPKAGTLEYLTTEQLYIDPGTCIDCEACLEVCPVEAIYPDWEVPVGSERYLEINAGYFEHLRAAGAAAIEVR